MKSMTGFGRAASSTSESDIEVVVKSVNARFFEPRISLPPELQTIENEIKNKAAEFFGRGRVEITVWRKPSSKAGSSSVRINEDLAKEYLKVFRALGKKLKVTGTVGLELLLRQPGVVLAADEKSDFSEKELKVALTTVTKALENCDEERLREGRALHKEFERILNGLQAQARTMESLREEANKLLEERFRSRLAQLGFTGESADSRLWQEVSLQADKSDIREEIVRLAEHIRVFHELVKSNTAQGKKLDFYTQELLRETNTIGSKSQVSELTQAVVEAKTLVEKLREQVQNIE